MSIILSVIAVCLVMITAKLYIPQAQAEVDGMDSYSLSTDWDFKQAVKRVVNTSFSITVYENINVYNPEYVDDLTIDFSANVSC